MIDFISGLMFTRTDFAADYGIVGAGEAIN